MAAPNTTPSMVMLARGISPPAAAMHALFVRTRQVRDGRRRAPAQLPLAGRNLALLSPWRAAAPSILQHAAQELGARVAHVHHTDEPIDMARLARMLGLFYDAIDCANLPADTVARIEASAGVPVFDDLGGERHPLCTLAKLMTQDEQAPHDLILFTQLSGENRHAMIQAVLLEAMI